MQQQSNQDLKVLVAIDIAKYKHDILIETPEGRRLRLTVRNCREDFDDLADRLRGFSLPCTIGFEPTADYHRAIAYYLQTSGFDVRLISSLAVARTREALHSTWDKNDPKDAQVMIHLLRNHISTVFHDPVLRGNNDLQELSNSHFQISLRKTRLQHSILNHYLPIYFPEAEKFFGSSRAGWFGRLLSVYPTPAAVTAIERSTFVDSARALLSSKQGKGEILADFYECARSSIGVPVSLESNVVQMFRMMLEEHLRLCKKRDELEKIAHKKLKDNRDYQILRSVPGIGPIIALTILAEAGDLRRFHHEKQFLKFCGLDLSTQQSGLFRGRSSISKRGNARLRSALWIAATVALRLRENTFRDKFNRYVKADPTNSDLKRRAYTAVTAKLARVIFKLIKEQTIYRPFYEPVLTGKTRSQRAVEAVS
ncbi:MAG: IS110 family transposase [Bdellovibrionaceae bacterium]|nr:IS110 family transposase [Pseudobdellovibrionaceae bacterium]